jgi:hypothetical protein
MSQHGPSDQRRPGGSGTCGKENSAVRSHTTDDFRRGWDWNHRLHRLFHLRPTISPNWRPHAARTRLTVLLHGGLKAGKGVKPVPQLRLTDPRRLRTALEPCHSVCLSVVPYRSVDDDRDSVDCLFLRAHRRTMTTARPPRRAPASTSPSQPSGRGTRSEPAATQTTRRSAARWEHRHGCRAKRLEVLRTKTSRPIEQ